MNTVTPPSTTTPSIDTLREQFAAGMLVATTAGMAEEASAALAAMHEAFDRVAALAARPQAEKPSRPGWLGPALPNWHTPSDANPLIQETPVDTTGLVTQCLEGVAFTLSKIGDEFIPRDVGPGLAQTVYVAIAALQAHSREAQA